MSARINWLLIFLILAAGYSCREEKVYPTIELDPNNPGTLAFNDTIQLKVKVKNYEGNVPLAVVDGDKVLPFNSHQLSERNGTFTYELYTQNRYIESGNYSIRIRASSSNAESSAYGVLNFTGLEKRISGFACVDASGKLFVSDSLGVFKEFVELPSCRKLAYNPRLQRMFLLEGFTELQSVSLQDPTDVYFRSEANGADMGFENLLQLDLETYLLSKDGYVDKLRVSGQQSQRLRLSTGEYATVCSRVENSLFCLSKQVSNNSLPPNLVVFNTATGSIVGSYPIPGQPLSVSGINANDCLILTQLNGLFTIYYFRGSENSLTKIVDTPTPFLGVEWVGNSQALLWGTSGLYVFNPNSNLAPNVVSNVSVSSLRREVLSGDYLLTSGNTLMLFTVQTGQSQLLLQRPTAILDGTIIYNK